MIRNRLIWGVLGLTVMAATVGAQGKPEMQWSATDIKGKKVSVPQEGATILVFLHPGQPQSTKAIEELTAGVKGKKGVQVIGIVSGEGADQDLLTAGKSEVKWGWPIVIDPQYAASGKFGVHVWPTTVVISQAGVQAAHIAGMPASYAKDLEAYLDFAEGRVDQAELNKRLESHAIIADSSEQKASRHVAVAMRLAEKGLKDQAKVELSKALDFKTSEPSLQASLARAFLSVGDAKTAEVILKQIKGDTVSPMEVNFLKGWSCVQGEHWEEAQKLLSESVKLNPDPSEALYLLGLVYQHNGDQGHAAECYRKAFEHTTGGRILNPQP